MTLQTPKAQATADLAAYFSTDLPWVKTVTYTPKGGYGVSIAGIPVRDNPLQEPYIRGSNTATCLIRVQAADVSSPQHGDTFTFDSETWEFDPEMGVVEKNDRFLEIALRRVD